MDSNRTKLLLASIFFVGCVALLYGRYQSVRPEAMLERSREERRERRTDRPVGERSASARGEGRGPGGMLDGMGPTTEEERRAMRAELLDHLQVTPEQRQKLDEIEKRFAGKDGREVWRERMEASAEVLTPEQQEKARQFMRTNMRAMMERRMRERIKVLPPEEQQLYMEKFEERRQEMEARWRERREARRAQRDGAPAPPQGASAP